MAKLVLFDDLSVGRVDFEDVRRRDAEANRRRLLARDFRLDERVVARHAVGAQRANQLHVAVLGLGFRHAAQRAVLLEDGRLELLGLLAARNRRRNKLVDLRSQKARLVDRGIKVAILNLTLSFGFEFEFEFEFGL